MMAVSNQTQTRRSYWVRLKEHPGLRVLAALAVFGYLGGGGMQGDWRYGLFCAAVMVVVFGSIVLWTARYER
jgi:hypothetical protein